jgi:hypothetical protein
VAPPSASSSEIWGDRPAMLLQSSKPPTSTTWCTPLRKRASPTPPAAGVAPVVCVCVSAHRCTAACVRGWVPNTKAGETLQRPTCLWTTKAAPTERSSERELHARANSASATQISAERLGAHSAGLNRRVHLATLRQQPCVSPAQPPALRALATGCECSSVEDAPGKEAARKRLGEVSSRALGGGTARGTSARVAETLSSRPTSSCQPVSPGEPGGRVSSLRYLGAAFV